MQLEGKRHFHRQSYPGRKGQEPCFYIIMLNLPAFRRIKIERVGGQVRGRNKEL